LLQRACSQKKQRLNVRNAPVELAFSAAARDESLETLPVCQFSFLLVALPASTLISPTDC
jgi:hypothetical protein